jgi:hypothetical protein
VRKFTGGALRFANWAILVVAVTVGLIGIFSQGLEEKVLGSLSGMGILVALALCMVRHPEYFDALATLFREEKGSQEKEVSPPHQRRAG